MVRKQFYSLTILGPVWAFLLVGLILAPNRLLADSELTPPLPEIGSVSATVKEFGYKEIKYDINRLGAREVYFSLYDTQGNPFPSYPFTYIKDGKLVPVEMRFAVDLEKSDGQYLAQYPVGLFAYPFGGGTEAPLTLGVFTRNIREKPCYGPTFAGSCTSAEENSLYLNPFTPGPVYLRKIDIKLVVSGTGQGEVVAQTTYNTRTKLFAMGQPPRLTSINKTSLAAEETATITGANFDVWNAATADNVNVLHFNLQPANTPGGYQESRVINSVGKWWEDRVHYCGPNAIKFDMPPDQMVDPSLTSSRLWEYPPLTAGSYTLTLANEWGYSNPITLNYTGGQGTPENDPACRNSPGVITSISPTAGPPGTVVTINGTGFGLGFNYYRGIVFNSAIAFGGVPADDRYYVDFKYETLINEDSGFPYKTGTQIRMKVPPGAKTGPVTVKPDGKFTIWGPTFTVTAGQVLPTPTPSGGGGTVAVEPPTINSVTPSSINIGAENTILIQGFGFQDSALQVGDSGITIIDVTVNESGTNLRAILAVDPEVSGDSVIVAVVNEAGRANTVLGLTYLSANAPVIDDVQVSPLDEANQATVVISGENFEGSQVEIVGGSARILDVAIEPNEITIAIEVSEFYSSQDSWDPIALTKNFLAQVGGGAPAATSPAVVVVVGPAGDTVAAPVDVSRAAAAPSGPGSQPLKVIFGLENPLKGDIKNIPDLLKLIGQFIFNLGIPVAVIIIIYAGFLMLTSGGNPTQYGRGLTALKYAVLGLAVILIGTGFVSLIKSILSVK